MRPDYRDIDPRELRLPSPRLSGADPAKLQRQIAQFGRSTAGMPPLLVYQSADKALVVYDGVTRATRVAKLAPGTTVRVEVIGQLRKSHANSHKIGDRLP
jgi:hypothetical protein